MDRLELARRKYQRIAPGPLELDEEKSDEIEAWLREYVVPLVSDLQRNPAFRRYVKFGVERLAAETDVPERQQVVAVSDALAACASEVAKLGDREEDRENVRGGDNPPESDALGHEVRLRTPQTIEIEDSRWIVGKMAERPWFDLVSSMDFPYHSGRLYVTSEDSRFHRLFHSFQHDIPVLGDGVTRLLFARLDFWVYHLKRVWHQVMGQSPRSSDGRNHSHDRLFAAMLQVDQCVEELKTTCFRGNDAQMRDSCCALMQVYAAFHSKPRIPWLDLPESHCQVSGKMLRVQFRRRGELIECERVDAGRIREIGRREASLIDIESVHTILAAIEDVAELYRRDLFPEEIIDEARSRYRLVVVAQPRMAFFDGVKLDIDWNRQGRLWELCQLLAEHGERLECVDRHHLSGSPRPHAFTNLKSRLCRILMESDDSPNGPATQLAALIENVEGEMRLDLPPNKIKVINLSGGADEWNVDPSEFDAPALQSRTIEG